MPRISQLTAATSIQSGDLFVIVHADANYKIAASDINMSALNNDAEFVTNGIVDNFSATSFSTLSNAFTADSTGNIVCNGLSSQSLSVNTGSISFPDSSVNASCLTNLSAIGVNSLNNDAGYISSVSWTDIGGTQNSINVSGFNNDAGYTTSSDITNALNSSGFITGVSWPEIGGDQHSIGLSGFNNDAGFLTIVSVNWPDIGGDQSTINVGGFNNNVGDISGVSWTDIGGTQNSINLSGFSNDAGFVTSVTWADISGDQSVVGLSGFSNNAGFISVVTWPDITGDQTRVNLSGFNNDGDFTTGVPDYTTQGSGQYGLTDDGSGGLTWTTITGGGDSTNLVITNPASFGLTYEQGTGGASTQIDTLPPTISDGTQISINRGSKNGINVLDQYIPVGGSVLMVTSDNAAYCNFTITAVTPQSGYITFTVGSPTQSGTFGSQDVTLYISGLGSSTITTLTGFLYGDGANLFSDTKMTTDGVGNITATSLGISSGVISLNSDGSASFGNNKVSIGTNGSIASTSLTVGGGNISLNDDGTASFLNGHVTITSPGNISASSLSIQSTGINLNDDGSAAFAFGSLTIDTTGAISASAITLGGSSSINNTGTLTVSGAMLNNIAFNGTIDLTSISPQPSIGIDVNSGHFSFGDGSGGSHQIVCSGVQTVGGIRTDNGAFFTDGSGNIGATSLVINSTANFLNADGSAQFAGGACAVDNTGNIIAASFSTTSGNFNTNGSGDVLISSMLAGGIAALGPGATLSGAFSINTSGDGAASFANSKAVIDNAGNIAATSLTINTSAHVLNADGSLLLCNDLFDCDTGGNVTCNTLAAKYSIVTNSTTSITLDQSTHNGKVLYCTNASAVTVTLPDSLDIGFNCVVVQAGTGQVTFSPASGATMHNRQSQTKTAGQWAEATLVVVTNASSTSAVYVLGGDTA